ncbi:hypothetical protein AAVH_08777 [Aphelenchoides avenae]|nr:hypothetical protein AAVH_08777 [Aphelenchus avenae]
MFPYPKEGATTGLYTSERFVHASYLTRVSHVQRDLAYTDVRRFKIPSPAGAANDCDLIRHYLGNSHVTDLQPLRVTGFPYAIKMFASLATRNFPMDRMQLTVGSERLSDYRSLDAVFGGMRMSELYLRCDEHRFVEFVKITDFFRMPTVRGLRRPELTLTKVSSWAEWKKPRDRARSMSPLWVSGIFLLRDCAFDRVIYLSNDHLRAIERKIVRICEAFERGEITATVDHFQFEPRGAIIGTFDHLQFKPHAWTRMKNASTNEYLTACVGQSRHHRNPILHILKGEVFPDASFSHY